MLVDFTRYGCHHYSHPSWPFAKGLCNSSHRASNVPSPELRAGPGTCFKPGGFRICSLEVVTSHIKKPRDNAAETILGETVVEEDKERETQERDQTEVRPSQSLQPTRWPHEEAQPTLQEADTSVPAEPCLTGPGNLKGVAYYAAIKK